VILSLRLGPVSILDWTLVDDLVDQAEFTGLLGRHEIVPIHGRLDLFKRLAGMIDINLVQARPGREDLLGVDLDIRRLC